jgi:hypothetical protein
MKKVLFFVLLLTLLSSGCSSTPAATVTPTLRPTATVDPYFASLGGGEPRTAGYWLLWNSCAAENNAETAIANGGREAGWYLVDDFLVDPGIKLGGLTVETCPQAIQLLQTQDGNGIDQSEKLDFRLASALLATELNLSAKAESCPAVIDAVLGSMQLLNELGFDGIQTDLMAAADEKQKADVSIFLVSLEKYNQGDLCR